MQIFCFEYLSTYANNILYVYNDNLMNSFHSISFKLFTNSTFGRAEIVQGFELGNNVSSQSNTIMCLLLLMVVVLGLVVTKCISLVVILPI